MPYVLNLATFKRPLEIFYENISELEKREPTLNFNPKLAFTKVAHRGKTQLNFSSRTKQPFSEHKKVFQNTIFFRTQNFFRTQQSFSEHNNLFQNTTIFSRTQ